MRKGMIGSVFLAAAWWPAALVFSAEQPAATQPAEGQPCAVDLGAGVKMEFVWLDALKMWVGKYEVTNGEYRKKEPTHDSKAYQGHSLNGDRQPAVNLSPAAMQQYAAWLTEREKIAGRLPAGCRYRLPTAAEWTIFAQCGDGRAYPWGDNWPPVSGRAGNYDDYLRTLDRGPLNPKRDLPRAYQDGSAASCEVEKSWANPWGLFGVGGNVWEAVTNERDEPMASKGGSWDDFRIGKLGIAATQGGPSVQGDIYGFRLVLGREGAPPDLVSAADEIRTPAMAEPPPAAGGRDIIDDATPLENQLRGAHPRLFLTARRAGELKAKLGQAPYAAMFARVRQQADSGQGGLAPAAFCFLMTGERRYLETAAGGLRARAAARHTGHGVTIGNALTDAALAYDWLNRDLDAETLRQARDLLARDGGRLHADLGLGRGLPGYMLTQNLLASALIGLTAAAGALYGDAPDIAPWVRVAVEKARNMIAALGPDGVSSEGMTYGSIYHEGLINSLILIRDLAGVDLFRDSQYLRNVPLFYRYSTLPSSQWRNDFSGQPRPSFLLSFADGARYTTCGPDSHLHALAAAYRDPLAQWLAGEYARGGAASAGTALFALLNYDPTVPAGPPGDLPGFRHFSDKGLVIMRTGWDGGEAVLAFICGPPFGHHALERYTGEIGGGHMLPGAGGFQLFARGERMISGDGYAYKRTVNQNTLLVNGVGQLGDNSVWFESLPYRRERRAPRIIRAESRPEMDLVIADVAPAYRDESGLTLYRRHVYRLGPDTWVVADEVAAQAPAVFELLFHSDLVWRTEWAGAWTARGARGALRLTSLAPADAAGEFDNRFQGASTRQANALLRLRNRERQAGVFFLTVLETRAAGSPAGPPPTLADGVLALTDRGAVRRFQTAAVRTNDAAPLLIELREQQK